MRSSGSAATISCRLERSRKVTGPVTPMKKPRLNGRACRFQSTRRRNAAHPAVLPVDSSLSAGLEHPFLQDLQQIPGTVPVQCIPGLAHVQDDRQPDFGSQGKLLAQDVLL